ncbi:hypothetical protein CABS01_16731 [Colletotrichum abscissum]|uniref:Uncharacterized protein n=2 Tax=Colletotrichum acutatum species complex TaxID=2707335 RepID=A0A9P9X083_9PEZI|nr:uncharacterized protein CABS01_16731 [Colletotrichum abscissum]KAI3528117.1 hypothetical protein CABS02_15207 [Colletotrichum abscissum]KAK0367422.1 hypothetical protein CLIM01_15221 [Colletotrichum limetticola]KAK1515361.1 hypothetical protein CABS01_16731 [Colletotrichum abscissum]
MKKIRTKASTDTKLRQRCEGQIGKLCVGPVWLDLGDLDTYEPNADVVFLLVDMRNSEDAVVYIHNSATSETVDIVGSDDFGGHMVIIKWEAEHFLKCYGAMRVAMVKAKLPEGSST